jgi:hypothetical protein
MNRIPDIDATYCFVRDNDGSFAVQVRFENGYFVILTDDQLFERGFGWATEWKIVPAREVPKKTRRALRHSLDSYVNYVLECE